MIDTMLGQRSLVHGTHFAPDLGVYAGWVAHRDSQSARRSSKSDRIILLLSGECLAAPDLTDRAGGPGADIDALANDALARLDDDDVARFVTRLNGLFSGLLIAPKDHRAFLFNDRYGSERLYAFQDSDATYFASEAKALLRILPEVRQLDDEAVAQFLSYGSVLHDRTLFRNLQVMPGGSLWAVRQGNVRSKRRYFVPDHWASQAALPEGKFDAAFADCFKATLPAYLESDLRIGISLTGGLDTRMIMACLGGVRTPPISYTFDGLTGETLDSRLARRVAAACGLEHHILRIGTDFVANYRDYVDETVIVTDGCAGALQAHEIYLTSLASELAPIRLTGNFGSEVFRSISTFKPLRLADALTASSFRDAVTKCVALESKRIVHPVTHAAFEEIPWHLSGTLAAGRSRLTVRTPYLDNRLVQLAYRAPDRSRKSPKSALKLVAEAKPLLTLIPTDRGLGWKKWDPSAAARRLFCEATFKLDYMYVDGLPHWLGRLDNALEGLPQHGLLGLHKFLPYRKWFRREFAAYAREVFTDNQTSRMPYWDARFLSSAMADHEAGRRNYLHEIHAVLTLEAVDRLLVRAAADDRKRWPSIVTS